MFAPASAANWEFFECCYSTSRNGRWASPVFFGPCTLMRTWGTHLGLLGPDLSFRPKRTRISYFAAINTPTSAALRRERRTNFSNATELDRKSGVAQRRDLLFLLCATCRGINLKSLHHSVDHAIRARIVGIEPHAKAQVITEELRNQNLKGRA
jgi:hypothetical protein